MRSKVAKNDEAMSLLKSLVTETPKHEQQDYEVCYFCNSEYDDYTCPHCEPINLQVKSRNLRDCGSAY